MTVLAIMAIDLATAIRQKLQEQALSTCTTPVQVVEDSEEQDFSFRKSIFAVS